MKEKKITKRTHTLPIIVILLFLSVMITFNACKKVDDHYSEVANQPWVTTAEIYLGANGTRPYDYPKSVFVGDTISLQGKMFIDKGGYVEMGAVKAVLISDKKITSTDGSTLDQVRFIVTKMMGSGNTTVKVVANGTTINLPSISIQQFAGIPQRTDSTLFVDEIAQFTPGNPGSYTASFLNLIYNSSVDANGNIWFDNPLGIFKVNGSAVENVLKPGSILTDASGPFIINRILGSVISYDGNMLTFSASVSDNADTVGNYVFKLCQLNVAAKTVTTLNRTLVGKSIAKTEGSPGAFSGAAAQMHVVAMSLRTDANNTLYFTNCYLVPSPNTGNPVNWYGSKTINGISTGIIPYNTYMLSNICKLTSDNQVSSLFSNSSGMAFTAPGYPVAFTNDYKISPDGSTAYVYDNEDFLGRFSVLQYDLQKKLPLHSTGAGPTYRFLSYDADPATTYQQGSTFMPYIGPAANTNGDYALQPLANGTLLTLQGTSIVALNNLDQTSFLFAGTEIGLSGSPGPVQTQTTGKAKNVLFSSYGIFCGIDKNGGVYYASSVTGGDLSSAPLTFYKIYSKK